MRSIGPRWPGWIGPTILFGLLVAGCGFLALTDGLDESLVVSLMGVVAIVGGTQIALLAYLCAKAAEADRAGDLQPRVLPCPACGRKLVIRRIGVDLCPGCGGRFDAEVDEGSLHVERLVRRPLKPSDPLR